MSFALSPQALTAALAAPAAKAGAVATINPWSLVPPLGNLDAYISAVNRLPMLTLEQEQEYSKDFKENNNLDAAGKLVLSHLRLVVSISRKYLGYGLPHGDLIQEGNIGLMKAVKRFDPDQGVRLVSYAIHWIKAEIHEYILKNWRMVKVATTKAQRKLFFNLRSMKQGFKDDADALTHRDTLTEGQVESMAKTLNDLSKVITAATFGVCLLSLLVGGIGILNIMLVAVTERTREIGVRKALGARRAEILFQFLMEAAFLTSLGGVLGIVLGSSIGWAVHLIAGFPISMPWWSFALGIGFSASVGIFFGMYPAVRASRLDPIEALRYE